MGAVNRFHPTICTTSLSYGPLEADGRCLVTLIADHRVLDGAAAARALQTLERVLRDGQAEAIATVAYTIRNKIGLGHEYGDDHEFLLSYYDAIRARMERGLLFGKRRADKFDRAV